MISLGIESTAHTFGVGIFTDKGKCLANERALYTTESGGIIPQKAVEHHVEKCDQILKAALEKAKLSLDKIDIVSFSQGPGIGHTLRVGALMARSIALQYNKPLVGVNHCIAHLEIGQALFKKCKDPILLYASGANTQIIAYEGGKYRIFGETLDNGIGNFLDGFARTLGLGFPGGPKVYELSLKSKKYIELPYVVKGMDVSFGGIQTNLKQKLAKGEKPEDLAYSVQETVFAMLCEITERALAHCQKKQVVIGGGVGCNIRLQEMVKLMCKERGAEVFIPENQFLIDNGAMIAWLGILQYKAGHTTPIEHSEIRPYERTDDIEVTWR